MDFSTLRAEFPVTRQWAFFDHAAVAPLPRAAARALSDYAQDFAEHGVACVGRWTARVEETRRLAAELLNASVAEIALIPNTTHGLGLIAEGFPWQPGDNVVFPAEEYPSNQYPWMNLAGRGVDVRRVPSRGNRVERDDLFAAVDARTRVLALSAVEYASGFRNDLEAIGSFCRERGIFCCVDAIQALGVLPLDVQALPIDALAADGHKWLLGPEGAGLFWIRPAWLERLHPIGVGWKSVVQALDFHHVEFRLRPDAARWEGGSLNVAGLAALGASLALLLEIGLPALTHRVRQLTDHLLDAADTAGLTVFSSREPGDRSGIVSFACPGRDVRALAARCREQGMIVAHRAGRLRVSPHAYNTETELDRLVEVLAAP